jgi:FAD binding domain
MAFGGMMIGRNDLPHIFQMSRSLKPAPHVGLMVRRYARDRLTRARGTRHVNGNALIQRMAAAAIARGIPLWLSSPIVELRQAGGRIVGAVVDKEGKPVEPTARLGVVLACGGFPGNDDLTRRLYAHRRAGKNHATLPPSGNAGDGLRLTQSVGGRLHDAVHPGGLDARVAATTVPFGASA